MRSLLSALALVITGALVALTAPVAPAQADSASLGFAVDKRFPSHLDLRVLKIDNREERLDFVVALTEFAPRRTTALVVFKRFGRPKSPEFRVGWSRVEGKRQGKVLLRVTDEGTERVRCPGLRFQIQKADARIRMSIPQTCLGSSAGTIKAHVVSQRRTGEEADWLGALVVTRG